MKLSGMTWVRFIVWMAVGFLFYAICLLTGTTDSSYRAAQEKRKARKYSRVSASGFRNKGIDDDDIIPNTSNDIDIAKQKINNNTEKGELSKSVPSSKTNGNAQSSVTSSSQLEDNMIQITHMHSVTNSSGLVGSSLKAEDTYKRESIKGENPEEVAALAVEAVISEASAHPSVIHIVESRLEESKEAAGETLNTHHSLEATMTFTDGLKQ